jgi:threonine/homoserine/homoserine lactone efflux protein
VPNLPQVFLQGAFFGFSIAAPVGPIGLLCIRRTLATGRRSGFVSGLGAATADATYGGIAGFGITFLSAVLVSQQLLIRSFGGAFLILGGSLASDYLSTLALTLSNPLTIIAFAAIFAGFGVTGGSSDYTAAAFLVSGVFAGSALWWVILSGTVSAFRGMFDLSRMRWVNRLSGALIASFGLTIFLSLFA